MDADSLTNGEENVPSIFSSAGLTAGAFLSSPYASNPAVGNISAPDIQVREGVLRHWTVRQLIPRPDRYLVHDNAPCRTLFSGLEVIVRHASSVARHAVVLFVGCQ